MIFPIFVFLITINSSVNGILVARNVIATFVYGADEGEFVKYKAIDVYNTEIEKGILSIDSVDSKGELDPEVVEIIQTYLQNDYITRTYYLNQTSSLSIFIAAEDSDNPNQNKNPDDRTKLQILPNVIADNDISGPHIGILSIPYSRVEVPLTPNIMKLTILRKWNKVFDCSVSFIEQGSKFQALRIKKANNQVNLMTLKNSNQGIFLECGKVHEEQGDIEEQIRRKPVFQASFGYMEELDDEYYAEIKIEPENTAVRIRTSHVVNRLRLAYGFINEEKNEIMFLRGSSVLVLSADDTITEVIATEDVSWAFNGHVSLDVTDVAPDGDVEEFRAIEFLQLEEKKLQYDNNIRTFWVLRFREVSQTANTAD